MRKGLDLRLLPVLAALSDHRSVSDAAASLGMTQPQMSIALNRLRQYFNDPLFIRSAHEMRPTPRATTLVEATRQILFRIERDLAPDQSFDPAATQRPITLAMTDAGEMVFLPRLFNALKRAAPQAIVHSVSPPARQVSEGLETGDIDLAIGYFPDLQRSNFFQQSLFADGFATLVRRDHPVDGRLSLEQYLGHDHAMVRSMLRSQEVVERELARRRLRRHVALVIPHVTSLPVIVAQTDLLVTLPGSVARYFTRLGENLRIVGSPLELPTIELKQHWHRRFHDDARSRWLRQLVAATFQRRTVQALPPQLAVAH